MLEALVRGLHLISVLAVFVGTLIVLPTGSSALDKTAISQLVKLYCLKLAALLVAMMSGLTLWLAIGKPAVFYSGNPVFHAKLGVFTHGENYSFSMSAHVSPIWESVFLI